MNEIMKDRVIIFNAIEITWRKGKYPKMEFYTIKNQ